MAIVDIAFFSKATKKTCQTPEAIIAKFGSLVGAALIARLADIRAASSIEELSMIVPLTLADDGGVLISVGDASPMTLVCTVAHVECPRDSAGRVRWSATARLQIIEIEVLR